MRAGPSAGARLKDMDNNGLLRRTLQAWFRGNVQPLATSKALFIRRNTLEYRLNRISELTGLDLGSLTTGCCCISPAAGRTTLRRGGKKLPGSDAPYPAWTMHAVWRWIETTSPARQRAAGMLLPQVSFFRSASISLILLVTTLSRWRKSSDFTLEIDFSAIALADLIQLVDNVAQIGADLLDLFGSPGRRRRRRQFCADADI